MFYVNIGDFVVGEGFEMSFLCNFTIKICLIAGVEYPLCYEVVI